MTGSFFVSNFRSVLNKRQHEIASIWGLPDKASSGWETHHSKNNHPWDLRRFNSILLLLFISCSVHLFSLLIRHLSCTTTPRTITDIRERRFLHFYDKFRYYLLFNIYFSFESFMCISSMHCFTNHATCTFLLVQSQTTSTLIPLGLFCCHSNLRLMFVCDL